jgi:hypothetical protein
MNYQIALWVLFVVLLICYSIVRKRQNKKLNAVLWILMILIFIGQVFLPRQLFGKWNSISNLRNKKIVEIILRPSEPHWEVNLVSKDFLISDTNHIDTLIQMLQKAEVYFPTHPSRIWETKMIIISADRDSLQIKIHQTQNNGTDIYTPTNEWRKDPIGNYLEKVTCFSKPVYGDTTSTK